MTEVKKTYYAGSDPFEFTFKMKTYMAVIVHENGKQTAEFYDDVNDLAYIGLSMWDDMVSMDYYMLDENGQYVPEKTAREKGLWK